MRIVSRMHPQTTRRQWGRAVTQAGYRKRSRATQGRDGQAEARCDLGREGGGDCHADKSAKTIFASQVRTARAAARHPRCYRQDLGSGRYQRRDTPDTPLDRCCNTGPAKHYPGSRKEHEGLAM